MKKWILKDPDLKFQGFFLHFPGSKTRLRIKFYLKARFVPQKIVTLQDGQKFQIRITPTDQKKYKNVDRWTEVRP